MNEGYINRNDIEIDGSFVDKVSYKPYGQIIIMAGIGIAFFLLRSKVTTIIGIAAIAVSVIGLVFIKDRTVLEFYTDCLIFHDKNDADQVRKINYADVKSWGVDVSNYRVAVRLQNDEVLLTETMQYMKAFNVFNKLLKEKGEVSQLKSIKERFFK